jgi:hypothetical protein
MRDLRHEADTARGYIRVGAGLSARYFGLAGVLRNSFVCDPNYCTI